MCLKCCLAAFGRIGSGSEGVVPDVYLHRDGTSVKCLTVSVADDETATFHLFPEHVVHGVAATATNSDDLDHRLDGCHRRAGLNYIYQIVNHVAHNLVLLNLFVIHFIVQSSDCLSNLAHKVFCPSEIEQLPVLFPFFFSPSVSWLHIP